MNRVLVTGGSGALAHLVMVAMSARLPGAAGLAADFMFSRPEVAYEDYVEPYVTWRPWNAPACYRIRRYKRRHNR